MVDDMLFVDSNGLYLNLSDWMDFKSSSELRIELSEIEETLNDKMICLIICSVKSNLLIFLCKLIWT